MRRMRGFTLIEVIISLAIVSVMLALGIPSFRGYNKQVSFDTVASSVAALVADARTLSLAPESNKPPTVTSYGVKADATAGKVSLNRYSATVPPQVVSTVREVVLTAPVVISQVPTSPILFPITNQGEPKGLVTPNNVIKLTDPTLRTRPTRTLTVHPVTGQVTIQ